MLQFVSSLIQLKNRQCTHLQSLRKIGKNVFKIWHSIIYLYPNRVLFCLIWMTGECVETKKFSDCIQFVMPMPLRVSLSIVFAKCLALSINCFWNLQCSKKILWSCSNETKSWKIQASARCHCCNYIFFHVPWMHESERLVKSWAEKHKPQYNLCAIKQYYWKELQRHKLRHAYFA